LEAFAPAYFTASATENIPRIPVVSDPETMRFLIEKGREMAELENPRINHELQWWVSSLQGAFVRPFNLLKFSVDEEEKEIRLYADGDMLKVTLTGLPDEVLRMTISGYNVITCWLKFHSYAYTRTEFMRQDYLEFLGLLSKLDMQMKVIKEIDTVMDEIIAGNVDLM
jgi:hypothetical protein